MQFNNSSPCYIHFTITCAVNKCFGIMYCKNKKVTSLISHTYLLLQYFHMLSLAPLTAPASLVSIHFCVFSPFNCICEDIYAIR